jgi:sec-independent protein translocase protein TatA
MFGKFGTTEIILILAVVLLFFGGKKIPEMMRGLGRGVKEFKDASKGEGGDALDKTEGKYPSIFILAAIRS